MQATAMQQRSTIRDDTAKGAVERRCVVTRQLREKSALIRFVVGPDRTLVPDIAETLPGRGLWITACRKAIEEAARGRTLAKAVRGPVSVAPDLAERVEALLARRCIETIGLARRAGAAVSGFDKARQWLRAGRGRVILAAADGAAAGRDKIRRLAPSLPVVDVLTAGELGGAFGRDYCVHAVLAETRLADRLLHDAARLAGFRSVTLIDEDERS